jgi:hypothetical protein
LQKGLAVISLLETSAARTARVALGFVLLAFQLFIIVNPQLPMVERPLHLMMTTALAFLWSPLKPPRRTGAALPSMRWTC